MSLRKVIIVATVGTVVVLGIVWSLFKPAIMGKVLETRAASGDSTAVLALAKHYHYQALDYCKSDPSRAQALVATSRTLQKELANRGNNEAMFTLAQNYRTPMCKSVPGEREIGMAWMEKAANHGNTVAMRVLAGDLLWRDGDDQTRAAAALEGVGWQLKAAEAGDVDAQATVGHRLMHGKVLTKDYKAAVKWLEKAAAQGHRGAKRDLGIIHAYGLDEFPIRWKGVPLIVEAANQGDPDAEIELVNIYLEGKVVPVNHAEARRWAKKAAKHSIGAQVKLALMYYEGSGGKKDIVAAHAWANVARASGVTLEDLSNLIAHMESEMSSGQRQKAEAMAARLVDEVDTV